MQIGQYKIEPGETSEINLYIGKLPTGSTVNVKAHVYRSVNPGPTGLILAGMHGDEINSIEIVRQSIFNGIFKNLISGSIIAIPVLNIYGFMNFSRYVPDGKDVNRSFPGFSNGSLASRVAKVMSKKILPLVDFGLDFHTGGDNRFNYPQVRYSPRSQGAYQLALSFNAPIMIEKSTIRKTLRSEAKSRDIPILVYEGGESLRLDGFAIETGLQGIKNVLIDKKMLNEEPVFTSRERLSFKKTSWIRAHHSGIFIWSKSSGNSVRKGETIAEIYNPSGTEVTPVISPRDGFLIGHNNTPVVNIGDALFNLGYK